MARESKDYFRLLVEDGASTEDIAVERVIAPAEIKRPIMSANSDASSGAPSQVAIYTVPEPAFSGSGQADAQEVDSSTPTGMHANFNLIHGLVSDAVSPVTFINPATSH